MCQSTMLSKCWPEARSHFRKGLEKTETKIKRCLDAIQILCCVVPVENQGTGLRSDIWSGDRNPKCQGLGSGGNFCNAVKVMIARTAPRRVAMMMTTKQDTHDCGAERNT